MKLLHSLTRLAICLLAVTSLVACKDIGKLLSGSDKSGSDPATGKRSENPTKAIIETPACLLATSMPPEDIEVYAIDGQDWINKTGSGTSKSVLIDIFVDNSKPVALLFTAKDAAHWQIKPSARTQIWAVYVTAEVPQKVSGIVAPTTFIEHYQSHNDQCGFYWAPEYQIHQLYGFTKKLFGKPYLEIVEVENGKVKIREIEVASTPPVILDMQRTRVAPSGYTSMQNLPPPPPPQIQQAVPAARMMTITEALRANVLRPGNISDINSFKSRYRSANNRDLGKKFDERTRHMPVYVITSDFTFPRNLAGANAVIFILEKRVPYPNGDQEHSPMLDMNSGTCMGGICDMLTGD